MLHFQRNYPHSATASIPVSCPPYLSLSLSLSFSPYRVYTMRRHLGRVHSSVFSIFFPPVSGCLFFFSPHFLLFLFFFLSPLLRTNQSQSDGNQRFVRRLQPICKFYPLLCQVSWITKVLLEPGRTRRLVFIPDSVRFFTISSFFLFVLVFYFFF